MPKCRYCEAESKLVKAHVIPEAFFRPLREGGGTPLMVSNVVGAFPKRAPIGVYDTGILCGDCKVGFGECDGYGAEILLSKFEDRFALIERDNELFGFQSSEINKSLLMRFLLSVLWRASVSSQDFYSRVRLGRFEALAKKALLSSAETPAVFDAVLSRWSDTGQNNGAEGLLCPFQERWNGVNAYRFYLSPVVAYIKVDQRPFPDELHALGLQVNDCVTRIVAREFEHSKDRHAFARVAAAFKRGNA